MTTLKDWPYWSTDTFHQVSEFVRFISNIRKDDIAQIQNLPNIFMSGRKVGKIPTSSADVVATDRVGDFNYDASFWYILVDNSGTAEWRRVALGSF